jgi:hypothetical protein
MNNDDRKVKIAVISTVIALAYLILFLLPVVSGINSYKKKSELKAREWSEFIALALKHAKYFRGDLIKKNISGMNLIEDIVKQEKLTDKIAYLKPSESEDRVSGESYVIQFDNINSKELIGFLYSLDENAIMVKAMNLKDYENDRLWSLKMYLEIL